MNDSATTIDETRVKAPKSTPRKGKPTRLPPPTNGEILVKGVVMGIIISGLTHASKSITRTLVRYPLGLFAGGLATGYLTHKYRKEIILLGDKTTAESKNFVMRQKQHLGDLISEIRKENNGKAK